MAIFAGNHHSEGVKVKRLPVAWGKFDIQSAITWKRCKIGDKFVLITNRKSYMGFRLVQKSVTLNDFKRRNGRVHCVSKKTSPTFLAITRESIVGFSYYLAEVLLRKQAIKWCYSFPPHLINASAPPCKTENTENVCFHVNVSCRFANRHTNHIWIITETLLDNSIHSWNDRICAPNKIKIRKNAFSQLFRMHLAITICHGVRPLGRHVKNWRFYRAACNADAV